MTRKKGEVRTCDCCEDETEKVTKVLTLADGNGVVLDQILFCGNCWHEREIFINDKSLDY